MKPAKFPLSIVEVYENTMRCCPLIKPPPPPSRWTLGKLVSKVSPGYSCTVKEGGRLARATRALTVPVKMEKSIAICMEYSIFEE